MADNVVKEWGEPTNLVTFRGRKNRDTGSLEEIRFTASEFNGRLVGSLRVWYKAHNNPTPEDDGYRPSRTGFSVREVEVDRYIEAFTRLREMIHGGGRSTSLPEDESDRNPRPRQIAKLEAGGGDERVRQKVEANRLAGRNATPNAGGDRPRAVGSVPAYGGTRYRNADDVIANGGGSQAVQQDAFDDLAEYRR